MLAKERQTAYYGSFTSGGIDALPDNTHLMGDARLDRDFGVQLDGDGDYVSLDTSWRTTSYASDGTFAIALSARVLPHLANWLRRSARPTDHVFSFLEVRARTFRAPRGNVCSL